MTKNAPDDRDELRATAEDPPTPESHPPQTTMDDPTRLARRDTFDSELGQNANKQPTDDDTPETDAESDGHVSPLDTLFSEPEEVHAFALGLAAGSFVTAPELVKQIAALAGIGIAGSRLQKGFDDYKAQARAELPYFIAGALGGYLLGRVGPQLVELGLGA